MQYLPFNKTSTLSSGDESALQGAQSERGLEAVPTDLPLDSNFLLLVIGTSRIAPTLTGGVDVQARSDGDGDVDGTSSPVLALDVAGVVGVGGS